MLGSVWRTSGVSMEALALWCDGLLSPGILWGWHQPWLEVYVSKVNKYHAHTAPWLRDGRAVAPTIHKGSFFVFNYCWKEPKMLLTCGWRPSAGSGESEKEPKIQNWKLIWSFEEFSLWILANFSFLSNTPQKLQLSLLVLQFSWEGREH